MAIREVIAEAPRPEDIGAPSAAKEIAGGIYSGIGSGLHDVGEALQRYGEQQETSKLHVAASQLHVQALDDLQNLKDSGDITNPEAVQKFNENYANKFSALTDDISSPAVRAHANELLGGLTDDLHNRARSDMAIAAGEQAVADSNKVIENLSSGVYKDPSSFDEMKGFSDSMIAAQGLPKGRIPEVQEKARTQLAMSAIDGMLDTGDLRMIERARADIDNGRYGDDLKGTQEHTMILKVQQAENHARELADLQDRADEKAKRVISDDASNEFSRKLFDNTGKFLPGTNYPQVMAEISKDNRLTPEAKREMTNSIMSIYRDVVLEPEKEAREKITQARADIRWDRQLQLQETAQDGEQRRTASEMILNGRITSSVELYQMFNDKQLSKGGLGFALGELDKFSKEGPDPTDPKGEARIHGYNAIKARMAPEQYDTAWFQLHANDENAKNIRSNNYPHGIPANERYDPASPHWIGKGVPDVDPKVAPSDPQGPTTLDNAKPAAPAKAPIHYQNADVMDKAYAHMPSGTVFIGPDGKTRRKP